MAKNSKNLAQGTKVKLGVSDMFIRGFGYTLVTLYAVACIIPFLIILGTSFTILCNHKGRYPDSS